MLYPTLPPDEDLRLAALRRYALLDTPPEAAFDRLAGLAASLFDVPLALVTLIDRNRQWFKACQGPSSGAVGIRETGRDIAFCAHTILSPDVLVAEDLRLDPRFQDNPLVSGDPHVRFYAGAPLITVEGRTLGALCLLDFNPRRFSPQQQAALRDLAASVVSEMELRRAATDLAESERLYRQMFEGSPQPIWVYDVQTLRFLAVNETAIAQYGYSREQFLSMTICDIRLPEDAAAAQAAALQAGEGTRTAGIWRHQKQNGGLLWADITTHSFSFEGHRARLAVINDVTERYHAEEALRESEERFRTIAQATPVTITVTRYDDGAILYANDRFYQMFGMEASLPNAALDATDFYEKPTSRAKLLAALGESECIHSYEAKLKKGNGEAFWVSGSFQRLKYQGEDALFSAYTDITERKQAEEALRRSEQRLSLHIQQTPLAVLEFDLDLKITAWNPAAERTFGYSQAEAMGRHAVALLVPDSDRLHVDRICQTLLTQKDGVRSTNRNRTKDGAMILCRWYNTPLVDDAGQVISFAALARDITEEKRVQEQLQESRERYKSLVKHHPYAVCSIDLDGRLLTVNTAFEKLTGHAASDVQGQSFLPLVAPDCLAMSQRHFAQTLEGRPQTHELTILHREGRRVETSIMTVPIIVEGAVTGIYAVVEDITSRKALEDEREELLAQTESLLADALDRADHDPLTGLLNHRAFHKRLEEETRCADPQCADQAERPLALLLMDLDNFKFFNDVYGHLAGDDLLRQVAQALNCCGGTTDTLARFGGDEFVLLMPGARRADAVRMADQVCAAIREVGYRPPGYDMPIPLSLSIGVACLPEDGATRLDALEAADAYLRVAKSGGEEDGQALWLRRDMAHSVEGFSMLDALVTAVDNKDRYTRKHSEDVMAYSLGIAQELGMDARTLHTVEIAALLHDVGKIGVPDSILRKPGKLSEEDFAAIKQHPMMGTIIVGAVPGFEETLDAIRHHHERWDGKGYPFGLKQEETPILARLMAVADAYSAMTTNRPYRKGMEAARALRILEEGAGTQWDPACVAAFLRTRGRSDEHD